jgi:hypothetical protein
MANSRREPSRRADARARYCEAAAKAALTPTLSREREREQAEQAESEAFEHDAPAPYRAPAKLAQSDDPTLTARVRALYEGGVVPVREIASLAGVTERTLYKYVRALGWTPRVTRHRGDGKPTSAQRAARGAGGRFIPLADADQPHAQGLKALDPDGAQRAAEHCVHAAALAETAAAAAQAAAQARAARVQAERKAQAQTRSYTLLCGALVELHKICAPATAGPRTLRLAPRLQDAILQHMERIWRA